MRSLLLSLGLSLLLAASASAEFDELYFTQRLMPIDQFDTRTWENRYYLDDDNYTPGGPLFVTSSASYTINSEDWMDNTHFFDIGREMNALLLHTEHRFYMDNRPTENTSIANLQYLNSRYAVDDVAALLTHIIDEHQPGAVILHGFDHGGAIAVWVAHRYPHLVDGLWASSATVVAIKDYGAYLTNVAEDIRVIGGQECYHNTELAFNRMEQLYGSGSYAELEAVFNVCDPFTPGDMIEGSVFFAGYSLTLGTIIRYSHQFGVESLCGYYDNHDDPMVALGSFLGAFFGDECVPISGYSQLTIFANVTWESFAHVNGMRQITYQFCREFGWYVSSSGGNHPFGNRFPIELFQQQCQYVFGDVFTTANMNAFFDETNRIFGGDRPDIENAYFTVGAFDPAINITITEPYRDSIVVDIIPGFGAGAEVVTRGIYPGVAEIQDRAQELIAQWIGLANRTYN